MKEIWFDMDGTIANLYAVDGWLEYLKNEDVFPYVHADTLVNFSQLARQLNQLRKLGWKIGVISWTAKHGSDEYNAAVETAKRIWLTKHLPSVKWDEIKVVRYGTNKWEACGDGILFDDEEGNRNAWENGKAFHPDLIMKVLNELRQI